MSSVRTVERPVERVRVAYEVRFRPTPRWKRLLDIFGSAALLILLAPLLAAIAVYIRLVSPGPVLFTQKRLGANAQEFVIYKFRTMQWTGSSDATNQHRHYVTGLKKEGSRATKPDYRQRLIPGGDFLRGHSLDELPQLFNVLTGSMSLVGPRPEVLLLDDYEPWQLRRFEVSPGITGLWQVSGKNKLSFDQMIRLDIAYIDRRSLWLDLQLLCKTVAVVLHRDNS